MIIENSFKQNDKAWHEARIDSVGGTGLKRIITNSTGERSKSRPGFLLEKAGDIISRNPEKIYQNWAMKWGHKYEPAAREMFELVMELKVDTCAMIFKDGKKQWHVSPDFQNEELRFGGEIKCPQMKEFKRIVDGNKFPTKHTLQCQAGLALTGWDHWWFMAYFPNLTPFIVKVERDEELIKIIKAEINIFNSDLQKLIVKLRG